MKIGRFVLMTIMAIVTLTVTCSAATGGPNGYAGENYKINAITGVDFRPYNTVTVGEFSDMLARAMFGDSADVSVDEDYADKPATISFIAEAYQSATGESLADAPLWRTISSGEYVASIEAARLIIQSPLMSDD